MNSTNSTGHELSLAEGEALGPPCIAAILSLTCHSLACALTLHSRIPRCSKQATETSFGYDTVPYDTGRRLALETRRDSRHFCK